MVDFGEVLLFLVIMVKGNYICNFLNFREFEFLEGYYWDEESSRGYIVLYNVQVNLVEKVLFVDFVKLMVYKFQGWECDEIVFFIVLDKKCSSQYSWNIVFVDNFELVNVVVLRV